MRIAALQVDLAWEDREENFRKLRPWIHSAAVAGARLVLLPETFSTGFTMATATLAEPFDAGPSRAFLLEQAAQWQLWLGGSFPEEVPGRDKPANTFMIAGPQGQIHRYRKIHPYTCAGEDRFYSAGTEHVTVEIEGLRLSLFVCYDLRFADEFWVRAPATDAYLVIANWPETRRHHWQALLQARAIENQAYVVGVNRVGTGGSLRYTGDSRIIHPRGEILAMAAEQETLLLADIDPAEVVRFRREFPFLEDRRPWPPPT